MSYESSEISVKAGRPVELFDLAMGMDHWRLTSAGYNITYLYNDYESAPCKCGEIKPNGLGNDSVEFELPRGHELAVMCIAGPPEQIITLTKYRGHGTDFVKNYTGYFTNFKFNNKGIPVMIFESTSSRLPMAGNRIGTSRTCPYKLYERRCGVNKESYRINGTIASIDGVTITSDEFADGHFSVAEADEGIIYGDLTSLTGCTYGQSSYESGYTAGYAFDNRTGPKGWRTDLGDYINQYIYCKWLTALVVDYIKIQPCSDVDKYLWGPKHVRIDGSVGGSSWTKIPIIDWIGRCSAYNTDEAEIENIRNYTDWVGLLLSNTTPYNHYRVYCYDAYGQHWGMGKISIGEIEMTHETALSGDYLELISSLGAGGEIIVGNAHRTIISHTGNSITINRPFRADVLAGMSFSAYAGCDHLPDTCRYKFDNMINFGGRKDLPVTNPYTGRNSLVR
jgi:hypothetical protein